MPGRDCVPRHLVTNAAPHFLLVAGDETKLARVDAVSTGRALPVRFLRERGSVRGRGGENGRG